MRSFVHVILAAVLLAAWSVPAVAGGLEAARFLGPSPGVKLMFEAPSGVRMERAAKQGEKGVLLIEEKTIFPADVTQADKDEINSREYELASEDGRIVQRLGGAELVLLDLDAESWTVPVKGGGEGPDVMSCRVEEQGEGQVLERRRGLVNVLCAYDGEPYLAYSMAEELGMVSFSILRDGKVVDSMRLAGRKSAGGD